MAPKGGKLNQSQRCKKTGNGTVGWTDGTLEASVGVLGTLRRRPTELALSDERAAHILVASDELLSWSREDRSTRWTDGPLDRTIGLSDDQVWTRQRCAKTNTSAPDEPTPWSRESIGLSSIQRRSGREVVFSTRWTDAPSVYSVGTVVSVELQRLSDVEGSGWTDVLEKHIISSSDATFFREPSQWLAECLGLLIPPPLAHLRLLDCVEVQESAKYLEDHIQSIQVLNCSSLDLHMLCVCA
jgi:hypothetical protein